MESGSTKIFALVIVISKEIREELWRGGSEKVLDKDALLKVNDHLAEKLPWIFKIIKEAYK